MSSSNQSYFHVQKDSSKTACSGNIFNEYVIIVNTKCNIRVIKQEDNLKCLLGASSVSKDHGKINLRSDTETYLCKTAF